MLKDFIKKHWDLKYFLEPNFLQELSNLIGTKFNVLDYLTNIELRNMPNRQGYYSAKNKKIYLDYNYIVENSKEEVNKENLYGPNYNDLALFLIYFTILHEAVHAYQHKLMWEEGLSSSKGRLLTFSTNIPKGYLSVDDITTPLISDINKGKMLYQIYHDNFIHEREANIKSLLIMCPIVKDYLLDYPGYKNLIWDYFFTNYDKGNYPLKELLTLIDKSNSSILQELKMDDFDAFIFGLPLSNKKINLYQTFFEEYLNNKPDRVLKRC